MNPKVLAIAGALAAVVAVGAVVTGTKRTATVQITAPDQALLPMLDRRINDVAHIQIEDSTTSVTLRRLEGTWRIDQADGFPANFSPISQLVGQLADLKKVEERTSNPALYERLDVQDFGPNAGSRQITLLDDKGEKIVAVLIGKSWFPPSGGTTQFRYARVAGDATSWLVSGPLTIQTGVRGWMNTELTTIPASRMHHIRIEHDDGEIVAIRKERETDNNYTLETIPPRRELAGDTRPNELASAFASLRFDEVFSESSLRDTVTVTTIKALTFDGLRLDARVFRDETKTYVAIAAAADLDRIIAVNAQREADAAAENEANEGIEDFVPLVPQLVDAAAIEAEAKAFNDRLGGWAFVMPSWNVDRLQRRNEFYLRAATDEEIVGGPMPEELDVMDFVEEIVAEQAAEGTPEASEETSEQANETETETE
jgi:hypothetical protein